MKKFFCFICLAYLSFPMKAQEALSLDSCRALAISNNKELLISPVSYTHLRAHETGRNLVCRLLLEKKKAEI